MKYLKRSGAIILALMMAFALNVTVFAAEVPAGGVIATTSETSITIKKEIMAFNPAESTINAPSITYSYEIEPGSAGKMIKDSTNISVNTTAGPDGAIITESISWDAEDDDDQMQTAIAGKANTKDITVNLSGVTFPAAGVYRYKITETATYTNTGVVDGEDHVRYLDVYVKNSETEGRFEIYGYVLFTKDNDIDGTDEASVDAAAKTEGFVGSNSDKYYTYNLTVGKTLTGDDGMKNHQFPFGITFTGSETGVLPIISGTAGTQPPWNTKGSMSSFDTTVEAPTLKIANGQTVTITGIPIGTSAVINEKNDVTGTTYASASSGADINADSKFIGTGQVSNDATVNAQTTESIKDKAVLFANTLSLISPTGLVMRYAPYALILVAGLVLLGVAMKRRSRKDDDED